MNVGYTIMVIASSTIKGKETNYTHEISYLFIYI